MSDHVHWALAETDHEMVLLHLDQHRQNQAAENVMVPVEVVVALMDRN